MNEQANKNLPKTDIPPSFFPPVMDDPIFFFMIFFMAFLVLVNTVVFAIGYTPRNITLSNWQSFSLPNLIILHLFFIIFPVVAIIKKRVINKLGLQAEPASTIFLYAPYLMWLFSGGFAMTCLLSVASLPTTIKTNLNLSMNVWDYYEYLYNRSTFYFIQFHAVFFFTMLFGPITILERIIISPSARRLEQLGNTIIELRKIKVESDDWTDEKWRRKAIEKNKAEYIGSVENLCNQWLEQWQKNRSRLFYIEAFFATTFLGERNFEEVRQMFIKDNMEPIRRWSFVTGKGIPL